MDKIAAVAVTTIVLIFAASLEHNQGQARAAYGQIDTDAENFEMELDLIQSGRSGPDRYFKVANYTITVEDHNATLKGPPYTLTPSVSIADNALHLDSLGILETKTTVVIGDGITETKTKTMPVYGDVEIDSVIENHKTNTTTYLLKSGAITIGDGIATSLISGKVETYPSNDNPKNFEGKLTLIGR